jgi:hypothetical protein
MLSTFRSILNAERDIPEVVRKIIATAAFLAALLCALLVLPQVREVLFSLAERILHHPLGDAPQRNVMLWTAALGGVFAFGVCGFAFGINQVYLESVAPKVTRSAGFVLLIIAGLFLSLCTTSAQGNGALWDDEFVTANVVSHPLEKVLLIESGDVHPPLYFLLLRIFVSAFGQSALVMKIFSIIPAFLTMLLLVRFLLKGFGAKATIFGLLAFAASSANLHYALEVRMYMWALFFVTLGIVAAWSVVKTNKLASWLILLVAVECAAYTHYYAGVTAGIGGGLLFLWFLRYDRKRLPHLVGFAVVAAALYLPWLPHLLRAFTQTDGGFWIAPMGISGAIGCFTNYFWAGGEFLMPFYALLAYAVFVCFFIKKGKTQKEYFVLAAFSISVLLALACITVSLFSHPLHAARYFFPISGAVWLLFGVAAASIKNRRLTISIGAFLLALVFASYSWALYSEATEGKEQKRFFWDVSGKTNVTDADVFYFPLGKATQEMRNMMFYFPKNVYVATGADEIDVNKKTGKVQRWHGDNFYLLYGERKITLETLLSEKKFANRRLWVVKMLENDPFPKLEDVQGLKIEGQFNNYGWLAAGAKGYKFNFYLVKSVADFAKHKPTIDKLTAENEAARRKNK